MYSYSVRLATTVDVDAMFTLSFSYSDCGLGEISYLNTTGTLLPNNKAKFYADVLDYIKKGEFEYKSGPNSDWAYKALITVSDRYRHPDYHSVSIYDMMTRYAPALKKQGLLKYSTSMSVRNPNSNNMIRQWTIACDGYYSLNNTGKRIYK